MGLKELNNYVLLIGVLSFICCTVTSFGEINLTIFISFSVSLI